jgi:hypothetical protein
MLGLGSLDATPSLHYFSLGNIMTIMEMNLRYKTMIVRTDQQTGDGSRNKDMFEGEHSTDEEMHQISHFVEFGFHKLNDTTRGNYLSFMTNKFDEESVDQFIKYCYALLEIDPNK